MAIAGNAKKVYRAMIEGGRPVMVGTITVSTQRALSPSEAAKALKDGAEGTVVTVDAVRGIMALLAAWDALNG